MDWRELSTSEKIDAIRDAYSVNDKRKSATDLAMILGEKHGQISRNSIIGLLHRHGAKIPEMLENGPAYAVAEKKPPRPRKSPVPPPKLKPVKKIPRFVPKPAPEPVLAQPEPTHDGEPMQLYKLSAHQCKWPVEGSGFSALFCAKDTGGHRMWCSLHQRLGYLR